MQMLHTHGLSPERLRTTSVSVVAPGTARTRSRTQRRFSGNNLHRIARQEFEQLLDRTIGHEWRRLREVELEQAAPDLGISVERDREIDLRAHTSRSALRRLRAARLSRRCCADGRSRRVGHLPRACEAAASLMNSLLTCRRGFVRHASQRHTSIGGHAAHRC